MRVQSNDPRDLVHAGFNESQRRQQARLAGGSWSQPPWRGWQPISGERLGPRPYRAAAAATPGGSSFLQKYAQDGDAGFFEKRGLFKGGQAFGSPFGLNHLETPEEDAAACCEQYEEPVTSTIVPDFVEPGPIQPLANLELETLYTAEPEQRAVHVPPYSRTLVQGLGRAVTDRSSALFEEPFEIPAYKGSLHRGRKR
jgi:hypothetical protein